MPELASHDDLLAAIREKAINGALLALARVEHILAGEPGPAAVRLALQGAGLALDQLARLGFATDDGGADGAPSMIIEELSPGECERIQRAAERAHHGLDPLDLDDELAGGEGLDLVDDADGAAPAA